MTVFFVRPGFTDIGLVALSCDQGMRLFLVILTLLLTSVLRLSAILSLGSTKKAFLPCRIRCDYRGFDKTFCFNLVHFTLLQRETGFTTG